MNRDSCSGFSATSFFRPSGKGRLFCNLYEDGTSPPAGIGIVFFSPFAGEMNKSRWIVAEQARRFARMGYAAVVADRYGTGNSEGPFGEATWDAWRDDIARLVDWLRNRGSSNLCFRGLRPGALLALGCSRKYRDILNRLLFWQPVLNRGNFLTQFLRL